MLCVCMLWVVKWKSRLYCSVVLCFLFMATNRPIFHSNSFQVPIDWSRNCWLKWPICSTIKCIYKCVYTNDKRLKHTFSVANFHWNEFQLNNLIDHSGTPLWLSFEMRKNSLTNYELQITKWSFSSQYPWEWGKWFGFSQVLTPFDWWLLSFKPLFTGYSKFWICQPLMHRNMGNRTCSIVKSK